MKNFDMFEIFRLLNVKDIVDRLHCNVCLLEYRGYGHSDGSPSEEGIYMDAQAALDYLSTYQRSDVIDPRKVKYASYSGKKGQLKIKLTTLITKSH